MRGYAVRRLLIAIPTLLGVSLILFTLLRLLPGDIAMLILTGGDLSGSGTVDPEALATLRTRLGLNDPIYIQYWNWLQGLATLNLGDSFYLRRPIMDEIQRAFPYTMELALLAIVLMLLIAIPAGVISALKQDALPDYALRLLTITGLSMPSFWLGLLIILFLVKFFNWIPPIQYVPLWADPATNLTQMIWPAMAIGLQTSAVTTRLTRSTMLEVMREDYVRTARAKGLAERITVTRHALRNALLPVVTLVGLSFAQLMGGAAIIETLFNVPGLGRLMIQSIYNRDFPNVQAVALFLSFGVVFTNIIVDLAYGWLDPRIRYR